MWSLNILGFETSHIFNRVGYILLIPQDLSLTVFLGYSLDELSLQLLFFSGDYSLSYKQFSFPILAILFAYQLTIVNAFLAILLQHFSGALGSFCHSA